MTHFPIHSAYSRYLCNVFFFPLNFISTMTHFYIHSAYYMAILYSFRNSFWGLKL
ncbi:hypothetical protein E2C01_005589 [Portunus trituberculatus]|uniref:Uncharacterized protein n=1 Tax=Portunus trituberculatus TaxID=210409 RepID=A0A5B7CVW9_PORTR|nr:hypothetical protein [Portunus trituberculatus]